MLTNFALILSKNAQVSRLACNCSMRVLNPLGAQLYSTVLRNKLNSRLEDDETKAEGNTLSVGAKALTVNGEQMGTGLVNRCQDMTVSCLPSVCTTAHIPFLSQNNISALATKFKEMRGLWVNKKNQNKAIICQISEKEIKEHKKKSGRKIAPICAKLAEKEIRREIVKRQCKKLAEQAKLDEVLIQTRRYKKIQETAKGGCGGDDDLEKQCKQLADKEKADKAKKECQKRAEKEKADKQKKECKKLAEKQKGDAAKKKAEKLKKECKKLADKEKADKIKKQCKELADKLKADKAKKACKEMAEKEKKEAEAKKCKELADKAKKDAEKKKCKALADKAKKDAEKKKCKALADKEKKDAEKKKCKALADKAKKDAEKKKCKALAEEDKCKKK